VAIIYINDLHGVEYYHTMLSEMTAAGYDTTTAVVMAEAVPPYTEDVELVVKQAQDSGADALCCFVYVPTTNAVTTQCMALGYNPNALVLGPGGNFEFYHLIYGEAVEGVIGFGVWNANSSPELADFAQMFNDRWGIAQADWWGAAPYYAGLQCLEQAIEQAGTLDNDAVRDVLATGHFDTILGDTWFYRPGINVGGGILAVECYAGQVGQWQNGVFEVIDPGDKRTAEPIYPKPDWPTE
jgi:branched-chain amino acid transport system substrate-binding protein